jgi:hypothetical protein
MAVLAVVCTPGAEQKARRRHASQDAGCHVGCWKRLALVAQCQGRAMRPAKAVKGERWAVGVQALDLAAVRRQIRTGFSKSLPCGDPLPACDDDAIWGNHGPVAGDAQSPMIADALRSVSRFRPQTVIAALIWRQCRGTAHPGTSSSRPERLLAAASGHTRLVGSLAGRGSG